MRMGWQIAKKSVKNHKKGRTDQGRLKQARMKSGCVAVVGIGQRRFFFLANLRIAHSRPLQAKYIEFHD